MADQTDDRWNPSVVYTQASIETPEPGADVQKYLFPQQPLEEVQTRFSAIVDVSQRQGLLLVAERLKFIDHLDTVKTQLRSQQMVAPSVDTLRDDAAKALEVAPPNMWGHDFAGADWDIEACQVYLLLTCIDTIMGQPEYLSAFAWLREQHQAGRIASLDAVFRAEDEYAGTYGPSRLFVAAVAEHLSSALRQRWMRGFAVVALDGAGKCIKSDSREAWEARTEETKMKAIATMLYSMRSQYTQRSARSYLPSQPVSIILKSRPKSLVSLNPQGEPLYRLLWDTVVHLAHKRCWSAGEGR